MLKHELAEFASKEGLKRLLTGSAEEFTNPQLVGRGLKGCRGPI